MKKLLGTLLVVSATSACVTSGDLRRIEEAIDDPTSTPADVREAFVRAADDAETRTEGFFDTLFSTTGGAAAGVTGIGMLALDMIRNARRKKRGETT